MNNQISYLVNMADVIGKEASILLENIIFWVGVAEKKKDLENHFREGKYWMYVTLDSKVQKDSLVKKYPFLTVYKIREALKKLEVEGYIESSQKLNKKAYDRTTWYTVTDKAMNLKNQSSMDEKIDRIYFSSFVAKEYGLNQAIVLDLLSCFVVNSKNNSFDNSQYFHNGRYWTKCSVPYISSHTHLSDQNVKTAIKNLLKHNLIFKDNFSPKESMDKSSWYSLTDLGETLMDVNISSDYVDEVVSKHQRHELDGCSPSVNFKSSEKEDISPPSVSFSSSMSENSKLQDLGFSFGKASFQPPIPKDVSKNISENILIDRLLENFKILNFGNIDPEDEMVLNLMENSETYKEFGFERLTQEEVDLAMQINIFKYFYAVCICDGSLSTIGFDREEDSLQEVQADLLFAIDVFGIMKEVFNSSKDVLCFAGKQIQKNRLKEYLKRITDDDVDYILQNLRDTSKNIKNPKSYIQMCLLNSKKYKSVKKIRHNCFA